MRLATLSLCALASMALIGCGENRAIGRFDAAMGQDDRIIEYAAFSYEGEFLDLRVWLTDGRYFSVARVPIMTPDENDYRYPIEVSQLDDRAFGCRSKDGPGRLLVDEQPDNAEYVFSYAVVDRFIDSLDEISRQVDELTSTGNADCYVEIEPVPPLGTR